MVPWIMGVRVCLVRHNPVMVVLVARRVWVCVVKERRRAIHKVSGERVLGQSRRI
jgi:hypothetical protein